MYFKYSYGFRNISIFYDKDQDIDFLEAIALDTSKKKVSFVGCSQLMQYFINHINDLKGKTITIAPYKGHEFSIKFKFTDTFYYFNESIIELDGWPNTLIITVNVDSIVITPNRIEEYSL